MGSETVVMAAPFAIPIENCCAGEVFPALSLTVTAKLVNELAPGVGMPLITPVELRVRPGGKDPITVQLLYGGVPPLAVKVAE